MYEVMYQVVPWKEKDDLNLSPCLTYAEAKEEGNHFYPEGYDIEEIEVEEYEEY